MIACKGIHHAGCRCKCSCTSAKLTKDQEYQESHCSISSNGILQNKSGDEFHRHAFVTEFINIPKTVAPLAYPGTNPE